MCLNTPTNSLSIIWSLSWGQRTQVLPLQINNYPHYCLLHVEWENSSRRSRSFLVLFFLLCGGFLLLTHTILDLHRLTHSNGYGCRWEGRKPTRFGVDEETKEWNTLKHFEFPGKEKKPDTTPRAPWSCWQDCTFAIHISCIIIYFPILHWMNGWVKSCWTAASLSRWGESPLGSHTPMTANNEHFETLKGVCLRLTCSFVASSFSSCRCLLCHTR